MIKIRYRDPNELSPGLHAAAERHGRSTVVYLMCGLTTPQRRAALRRLRLSARMGHCPRLPAAQLGLALLADLIRTAVGRAGAVFREHPAGSTVPVMMVSGAAIAFLALSAVSIRVLHDPRGPGQAPGWGNPSPAVSASAAPIAGPSPTPVPGSRQAASEAGQLTSARTGPDGSSSPPPPAAPAGSGTATSGSGTPGSGGSPHGTASAAPPPSTSGTGTSPPARPSQPPPSSASPGAVPSVTASFGPGNVCLNAGPFGVCLPG